MTEDLNPNVHEYKLVAVGYVILAQNILEIYSYVMPKFSILTVYFFYYTHGNCIVHALNCEVVNFLCDNYPSCRVLTACVIKPIEVTSHYRLCI